MAGEAGPVRPTLYEVGYAGVHIDIAAKLAADAQATLPDDAAAEATAEIVADELRRALKWLGR